MVTRETVGLGSVYPRPKSGPGVEWYVMMKRRGTVHTQLCESDEDPAFCSCNDELWATAKDAVVADTMCRMLNMALVFKKSLEGL